MGKTDSTGTYAYICDGTSPGSPVLADGHAVYTPGLSQNRGGVSSYYSNDLLGNLWTLDGTSKNQLSYEDTTGFGALSAGSIGGQPFGFGGGNGCETDADTGLVLMGHRYYDPRTGRFLSQDPAGDGDNWYAYADNSPTNYTDPTGLDLGEDTPGTVQYSDGSWHYPPGVPEPQAGGEWFSDDGNGGVVGHDTATEVVVPSRWSGFGMGGGMGPGVGILGSVRVYNDGVHSDYTGKSPRLPESIPPGTSQTSLIYDKNNTRIFRGRTYTRFGVRVRDYDFAAKGNDGPVPHGHDYVENATGGTQQRSNEKIDINTGRPFNDEQMMELREKEDPMPFFDFFDLL